MSTTIIGAQAVADLWYGEAFATANTVATSQCFDFVQVTADSPVPTLDRGTLDRWGARYRPPQEWYTSRYDEDDLFS